MIGPGIAWYLVLSVVLFATGALGVLVRRSPLIILLALELMLNAANLSFASFARARNVLSGQVIALFVIAVAAAEVVIGLAIIVSIFRSKASVDVDDINTLRG